MKKQVKVGNLTLGDGNIYVQSMMSIPAADIEGNVRQAVSLEQCGCDIIRVAVPTIEDVRLIPAIKNATSIPLTADIHFDYKIALECVKAGVDKLRINPGNIGSEDRIKAVVHACGERDVPIRIGVNSGSVEKRLLEKYGGPTVDALVESAIDNVRILEKYEFYNTVISIKSSSVPIMIEAYRKLSKLCNYPLHLGVTEAGTEHMGVIKNAIGIGSLLCDGIGDTIRVSLTSAPELEVKAAQDILKAIGRGSGVEIISCPTCGRTSIDLVKLVGEVEKATAHINASIKIAVMGCIVNGPGEAREADVGIAGGKGVGLLFKKGEVIRKVPENGLLDALLCEINEITKSKG